jgi:phosphoribosylanthranilate isomerase
MKTVKVKICGITREGDLEMICRLGADMVGFVVGVPSSPRNMSLERAETLFRLVPDEVKSVLVTVPHIPDQVLEFQRRLKPDIIQLHGGNIGDLQILKDKLPDTTLVRAIPMKVWALESVAHEAGFFDAILADSFITGMHGGTGLIHDWGLSRRVRDAIYPKPFILAGGLNPENIKEAIKTVRPYAVDVSTGVESRPGVKDPVRVEMFIKSAKEVELEDCEGLHVPW